MFKKREMGKKQKIIVFGNCQARHLCLILSSLLLASRHRLLAPVLSGSTYNLLFRLKCLGLLSNISFISNNIRTGDKLPNRKILAAIKNCDMLIYQPLGEKHGALSDANIRRIVGSRTKLVTFPYIFNSGVYSLCHAPMAGNHSYGMIFGQEHIIKHINAGVPEFDMIDIFRNGDIDFNLLQRFEESLSQMEQRELSTDIKLSGYIMSRYREEKLFVTHNHPTNVLFYEMVRQIMDIVPLPISSNLMSAIGSVPELNRTNCPVTPYCAKTHGYKFNVDNDWFPMGVKLIRLIYRERP